ncbi:MAG TPA: hypothetical protein DCQ93_04910 [Bacteroidetes bacterium]|nr:hypothetical protein [Bacteroidota bacterium]
MQKKILNLFFLLLFCIATTGVSITQHECNLEKCKRMTCTGKDDCGCCTTTIKYQKLNADYTSLQNKTEESFSPIKIFLNQSQYISVELIHFEENFFVEKYPPPNVCGQSYLQVFRI